MKSCKWLLAGAAMLAFTGGASAATFTVNQCQGTGTPTCPGATEEEMLFLNPQPDGTVFGALGSQQSSTLFTISSDVGDLDVAQGFAVIGQGGGTFNELTITAPNGTTFTDIIFLTRGEGGPGGGQSTGTFQVCDQDGCVSQGFNNNNPTPLFTNLTLTTGASTFIALATTGFFTSVKLDHTSGIPFDQVGQIRISGFSGPPPSVVPLPGALVLMGTVLMGGAGIAKWRKRGSRLPA